MDCNHKIWTAVILLRDDSVGYSSSGNVVTTWSRLSEICSYIQRKMGYDYQIWIADNPHEGETIRFSSARVYEVNAARSSYFDKCFCIQLFDNQSQIRAATIGEEPLNYIGAFVIYPPLTIFLIIYLNLLNYNGSGIATWFLFPFKKSKTSSLHWKKKILTCNKLSSKLNQSDKHFVRLLLLKEVYGSYESFFDIYLFELNNLETL